MKKKSKSKYAGGGGIQAGPGSVRADPKPMPLADRIREARARTAIAIGDATAPPKPPPPPKKPKPYAAGGPIGPAVMPTKMPYPPQGGFGMQGIGGAGSPMTTPPPMGGNPMDGRPQRDGRGLGGGFDPAAMRARFAERFPGMAQRMRPGAPTPVGPGGGYKKGGKIDGCATRGMTKGRNK